MSNEQTTPAGVSHDPVKLVLFDEHGNPIEYRKEPEYLVSWELYVTFGEHLLFGHTNHDNQTP